MPQALKLRVGIVVLLLLAGGYFLLKRGAELGRGRHVVRARLTDVRDLPVGAPVTLAGLEVGTIIERRVGPGYAEIHIQFRKPIDLREDATLFKRRSSLLSGPSLEIDPGLSEEPLPGKYIERVVETSPIGDILYEISEALPAVRRGAEEGMTRAENARAYINGPFTERVLELDKGTGNLGERMHRRLSAIDEALKVGESLQFDARAAIEPTFDRSEELTDFARNRLERGRAWVVKSASQTRKAVDDTKIDWSPYAEPIRELDEGEGTLGKLLNSDELHGDVVEIAGGARRFVRSIVKWQMRVGLRAEYATVANRGRTYVTLKAGRTNNYYYLELVSSRQGGAPEVQVVYDQDQGLWRREIEIDDSFRLTAQFARSFGPLVFRYGMKESTFGAGADLELIDERLQLSADVFEFGRTDNPRLKVAATYRLFGEMYILAGLDDVLNPGQRYNIAPLDSEQVSDLEEIYVGRDYFLGAGLSFNDRDLASLLTIGGDALISLVP